MLILIVFASNTNCVIEHLNSKLFTSFSVVLLSGFCPGSSFYFSTSFLYASCTFFVVATEFDLV